MRDPLIRETRDPQLMYEYLRELARANRLLQERLDYTQRQLHAEPPRSLEQIRDALSATGSHPLDVTGLNGVPGQMQLTPDLVDVTTATYTLTPARNQIASSTYSSTGISTVTLPARPQDGDLATVTDAGGNAGANNITVNGNGHNINGAATATIATNYGALRLVFRRNLWLTA